MKLNIQYTVTDAKLTEDCNTETDKKWVSAPGNQEVRPGLSLIGKLLLR